MVKFFMRLATFAGGLVLASFGGAAALWLIGRVTWGGYLQNAQGIALAIVGLGLATAACVSAVVGLYALVAADFPDFTDDPGSDDAEPDASGKAR